MGIKRLLALFERVQKWMERMPRYYQPLVFCVIFAAIGLTTLLISRAATPFTSLEAELSILTGSAHTVADASASNGGAIQFGSSSQTWRPLKIGAGGFLRGMDLSADGSVQLVRTDTYGAYVWNGTQWNQLVTSNSMPPEDRLPASGVGVFELRVAPHNDNRFYMAWNGSIYRSDNKGANWTKTALNGRTTMDANAGDAQHPYRMAVDPNNDSVVYAGIPQDGMYVTTDAGNTWNKITAIPTAGGQGYTGVFVDPSGGVTSGKSKNIYAHANGFGYYRSTDAGASWSLINGSSQDLWGAGMGTDGTLYTSDQVSVYRYKNGVWSNIMPQVIGGKVGVIAVDPTNSSHVVTAVESGNIRQTYDGGASWQSYIDTTSVTRVATDIPWLAWTNEDWMSAGDMIFDPAGSGRLYFSEGIGYWYTQPTNGMTSVTWTSQNNGIEQLVTNDVIAPLGGKPVVAVWDRGTFYLNDPDTYPSMHQPTPQFNASWDIDYSAANPQFIVSAFSDSQGNRLMPGYSTDGGQNFTQFASVPAGATNPYDYGFGSMAVGDTNHIVWAGSNSAWPYYTTNRGASWQPINMAGLSQSTADKSGFGFGYYLHRHIVAADRVNTNTFYLMYSVAGSSGGGIYKSTDGGANWSRVYTTPSDFSDPLANTFNTSMYNAELQSVPEHAGHLFFTAGHIGTAPDTITPDDYNFASSTDGGTTWVANTNVKEVYKFGFGRAMPGTNYPALYIAGWVNNQYGIWRSADQGQNWTALGDFPMGSLDSVTAISGDMNISGRVYVCLGGSGCVYRDSN